MPAPVAQEATFAEPGDLFASPAFMDLGSCRGMDPDVFFPDRGESLAPAKAVCGECIVRDECLEYALDHGERFGVWGGTSERERRRLRRARRESTKVA
jgi:WhiB family redox-sensing transcriptional regulator